MLAVCMGWAPRSEKRGMHVEIAQTWVRALGCTTMVHQRGRIAGRASAIDRAPVGPTRQRLPGRGALDLQTPWAGESAARWGAVVFEHAFVHLSANKQAQADNCAGRDINVYAGSKGGP